MNQDIEFVPGREIWDASDFYLNAITQEEAAKELGITAKTTDRELRQIVATNEIQLGTGIREAKLEKMDEFVKYLRNYLRDKDEE